MLQKLFYKSLKLYCRVALHFYFSRWQIRKPAAVPGGPVIFVSNHQNAFLDAVLVICSSHRNPWALARANVFKKNWAYTLLTFIQMMPVYRFRDGFDTLRKNEAIIENCAALLKAGESVLIFGEGNHNEHYNLRPLQKGFARIAQAALQQNVSVQLVPVGIHYEHHTAFRSRVLVSFGSAIPLANDYFDENPVQKTEALLAKVAAGITPLILSIPETNYEASWKSLQANRQHHHDLAAQLQHDQQLVDSPPSAPVAQQPKRTGFFQFIIRIYYLVNHFPARMVVHSITGMRKLDPQFIGSLKFATGMVLVPAFYILQIAVAGWLSGSPIIALLYGISLPLSIAMLKP
ncbi:MAG: 1-acyl-sn-glycerol-3-phosphate acyltransferase [Cyclobacteriaceae bacterium]|nr:1-acyl-sn-glycerol-3-phosphate acyltransferase [Cyclobacteriaceae bacterium]